MYSKVVLDALVESATDKEISRMIVVINEFPAYRDFADFHKNDPEWWANLADKVYTTSPFPKMALAPYLIAANQRLINKEDIETKIKPLVAKAMTIEEDNDGVQYMARIVMATHMGIGGYPDLSELRKRVLPKIIAATTHLDKKLTYREE